jgi:hypothetical protein
LALLIGQSVGEPTPQLPLCAGSHRATKPLDDWERWADDATRPQFLEQSSHQCRAVIGDERRRQQPGRQLSIQGAGKGAKPKSSLNLKHVLPASLIAFGVIAELRRIKAQLLSDEGA